MNNLDIVLSNLSQNWIGFDRLLDEFSSLQTAEVKYPPYNYIQVDDEHYTIEMAVAGFGPEDIEINTRNGILTVASKEKTTEQAEVKYIHRGIASRDFNREFKLSEYVSVTAANFHNGILSIHLEYKLPEHLQEHSIKINSTQSN